MTADKKLQVMIRNIRIVGINSIKKDNDLVKVVSGNVVADLWGNIDSGYGKLIASGPIRFLYEICNKKGHNLVNYTQVASSTKTLAEFNVFQKDYRATA